MASIPGDSQASVGPPHRRLDQISDIDEWLDALGDELAREFPDLEDPRHAGKPVGEWGANERGAKDRERDLVRTTNGSDKLERSQAATAFSVRRRRHLEASGLCGSSWPVAPSQRSS